MSKKTYNIFALVINFSKVDWQPKYHNEFFWGKWNYKTSFSNKLDFFSFFFLIILIILFFWITRKMPQFNNIIIIDNWVVKTTLKIHWLTNLWEPTMWELDRGSFPNFLKSKSVLSRSFIKFKKEFVWLFRIRLMSRTNDFHEKMRITQH